MLTMILSVLLLLAMGILGLSATGGLPGASKGAQDATKDVAATLAPYAAIIGIAGLVVGILGFIDWLSIIGMVSYFPITFLIVTASVFVLIGLGLILAYPLIAKALAGSGGQDALDRSLATVKPLQRPLSLAAIAIAILYLVLNVLGRAGVIL
ncbi:MAG: hypothetical protein IT548_14425 [Alphaproteobacteria bacterium]|nr:hypothetical protein [Alphaproteobacteria bacterium]